MFCIVIIVCTDEKLFTTCFALYFKQWQQSLQIRRGTVLNSTFKKFIVHAGHCDSFSFFPLKHTARQFKQNLCSHFNTFIGFFSISPQLLQQQRVICGLISVLLTSSNLTSDGISDYIWEEKELKKLWVQAESLTAFFGLPFRGAFTLRILLPLIPFRSNCTLSQISDFLSPVVEWWCAYSTLPFYGSRHYWVTFVADFFRDYLWVVIIYDYKIHFFNFVFIVFLIVISFPKKMTTDST